MPTLETFVKISQIFRVDPKRLLPMEEIEKPVVRKCREKRRVRNHTVPKKRKGGKNEDKQKAGASPVVPSPNA